MLRTQQDGLNLVKNMAMLAAALVVAATLLVAPASAAPAPSEPAATSAVTTVETEATASDLRISNWRDYWGGFTSQGTCIARGALWNATYQGTHQGAWHAWRCVKRQMVGCKPGTWMVQVRQWLPAGMSRVAPDAVPSAELAGCEA